MIDSNWFDCPFEGFLGLHHLPSVLRLFRNSVSAGWFAWHQMHFSDFLFFTHQYNQSRTPLHMMPVIERHRRRLVDTEKCSCLLNP